MKFSPFNALLKIRLLLPVEIFSNDMIVIVLSNFNPACRLITTQRQA